jgi:4-oxalmesaconate hydratase
VFDCFDTGEPETCRCFANQFGFLRPTIEASPSIASPTNIEAMPGERRTRVSSAGDSLVIDCHGHYTTEPEELFDWRRRQIDAIGDRSQTPSIDSFRVGDDRLRETVEGAQLRLQRERGTSITLFSPRASGMGHHIGVAKVSSAWSRLSNDLIHRLTQLYPKNFIGVCQLPQSRGVEPSNCIPELVRCVEELGFVGCNLNPDPSGGFWTDPPLTDRWWYPLYEKMVELDVPAMVHVSAAANRAFHTTGSHYINGDTTAFMQFLMSDLFKDFRP